MATLSFFLPALPYLSANSTALTSAPVAFQAAGLVNLTFGTDGLEYEIWSFFDTTQGLVRSPKGPFSLFNPGADIDFTTTTDFEDLAAPVADVVEFTDQDRALAVDSVASTLMGDLAAGLFFGASMRLLLSPAMWRDIV